MVIDVLKIFKRRTIIEIKLIIHVILAEKGTWHYSIKDIWIGRRVSVVSTRTNCQNEQELTPLPQQ